MQVRRVHKGGPSSRLAGKTGFCWDVRETYADRRAFAPQSSPNYWEIANSEKNPVSFVRATARWSQLRLESWMPTSCSCYARPRSRRKRREVLALFAVHRF